MKSAGTLASGNARGIAFLKGFGSYIAMIADVSAIASTVGYNGYNVKVNKIYAAVDCGIAVNPNAIEAQIQGGIVHGMSAALWGQVKFANGVPSVNNFNQYRVVKLKDMPQISVTIVNSGAPVGGVGELAVPCVAPAIANAFAQVTNGTRVRSLPFYPGATMGGL